MIEWFGIIGGTMLAFSGFPQTVKTVRTGHAEDLSWAFLGLWGMGEIFMLGYIIPKLDLILILNYAVNLAFLLPIVWFKAFPRIEK